MMQNDTAAGNARQNFLVIGERLGKKAFDIALKCPECGGAIENFSCPGCATKPDRAGVRYSGTAVVITNLLSWIMPFFCAGMGYMITHQKFGLVVGLVVGFGIGQMARRMESQGHQSNKARIASDFLLAQRYQQKPDSYDMAAFCYLHWLTTQPFPRPPQEMALFLWRYRYASSVNAELRQALLDMSFYKMCCILDAQEAPRTAEQANLMLAAANDSPEQLATAKVLSSLCGWSPVLQKLLLRSAPSTAAALAGQSLAVTGSPEKENLVVRYLKGDLLWPEKLLELDLPPEEQRSLRFLYVDYQRVVGITGSRILAGTAGADAEKAPVTFSEPLKAIDKVCEEWSPDGGEHRGLWFFAGDHAYGFCGADGLARTLGVAGALPPNVPVTPIRSRMNSVMLFVARVGAGLCALAIVTGIAMLVAGGGRVNDKGGLARIGALILTISFFPLLFVGGIWRNGKKGSRSSFLAACGCKNIKDFADRERPLGTGER